MSQTQLEKQKLWKRKRHQHDLLSWVLTKGFPSRDSKTFQKIIACMFASVIRKWEKDHMQHVHQWAGGTQLYERQRESDFQGQYRYRFEEKQFYYVCRSRVRNSYRGKLVWEYVSERQHHIFWSHGRVPSSLVVSIIEVWSRDIKSNPHITQGRYA